MSEKMQSSHACLRRRRATHAAKALVTAGLLLATACTDGDGDLDGDPSKPRTGDDDDRVGTRSKSDAGGAVPADDDGPRNGRTSSTPDGGAKRDGAAAHPGQDGGHVSGGDNHMTGGDGGAAGHACGQPYPKDPRDDAMSGELTRIPVSNGQYELQLPKEMLDWLDEHGWVQQHGNWHAVRRWDQGCLRIFPGQVCESTEQMEARGLRRAPIQEGEPGDGYAFLIMHRHMIQGLREAFPKHAPEVIRGFSEVPTNRSHPENPVPWMDVRWSADQLESIEWMENVDQHLDAFSSEDDYARWVQFGAGFGGDIFGGIFGGSTASRPGGGMHTALHAQWSVVGSPSPLLDNNTNVRNYAFWQLHVWLDDMWERYRQAAGLSNQDPEYLQALVEQCEEMHALDEKNLNPTPDAGVGRPDAGAVAETGVFATEVAPILTAYCGGSVCHGADSPTLGLALTGAPPSVVRRSLVNQQAMEADMALIEPGAPEQSWLYRKVSDDFSGIDCSGGACTRMPPAGAQLTDEELERIRAWIAAGATGD